MILLDVNVVVAAYHADHPDHATTRAWFDRLVSSDEQFAVPDGVWASFVRVVTSGRIFDVPASSAGAFGFLRATRAQPNFVAIVPGERHLAILEELCDSLAVSGDLVPDAYLAAIATEQGCSLASFDRDFARFEDLEWIVPS